MIKLLYVTYEWNFSKTCSSVFFFEILKKFFDVELFIIKDNKDLDYNKINNPLYGSVVFFQCEPDFSKITNPNTVFVPMYDTFGFTHSSISALKNIKLINFSRKLHKEALRYGIKSFYLQYYPKIDSSKIKNINRNRIFFWQRQKWNPEILFRVFPEDLKTIGIEYINLHSTEYKESNTRNETYKNAQVCKTSWFEKKEDLTNLLNETKYYFAPRDKEGIGFSFIDALAKGCVIIAHNEGTMNEYIVNNKTGYLINFKNPKKIHFKDFSTIQKASLESVVEGRKRFEQTIPLLAEFIESKKLKPNEFRHALGLFIYLFVRVWNKVMRLLRVK